jgi:hypothetical protein
VARLLTQNWGTYRAQEKVAEELLEMELKQVVSNYKFGILYAKEGQFRETDMFSNGTCHHRCHRARTPFPNSQALIVYTVAGVQSTGAKRSSTFSR